MLRRPYVLSHPLAYCTCIHNPSHVRRHFLELARDERRGKGEVGMPRRQAHWCGRAAVAPCQAAQIGVHVQVVLRQPADAASRDFKIRGAGRSRRKLLCQEEPH